MNFSTQEKIDKEMNDLAKSMASSQNWTVGELVKALGRDGVKKAMENMTEAQLVSFTEELKKHISGVPDSKLDSCVEDVTPKQGEQAAYAICTHQLEKSKCEKCMTKSDSNPDGLSGAMLGIAEAPKETEKTEQKKKEEKDMSETIQKSGEGSRGGNIIGHTKSGKPIYEHADHPSHSNFSKKDHIEAANIHASISNAAGRKASEHPSFKEANNHSMIAGGLDPKTGKKLNRSGKGNTVMQKSENIVSAVETATDRGGKFLMNNDPEDRQTVLDEMIAMDMAASEEMRTIGHQGGPEKDGAWEGQVIGEEPKTVSENQPEPKSENKDNNIADNIVEINALGKLSKPERDAMREKIIAFIEAMMERKIEKSVGLDILSAKVGVPSVKLHTIYDAIELQKSGEGSKGGKIIGHTKSGKAIYDGTHHPEHKNFSSEDHSDAAEHHFKISSSIIDAHEKKTGNIRVNNPEFTHHAIQHARHTAMSVEKQNEEKVEAHKEAIRNAKSTEGLKQRFRDENMKKSQNEVSEIEISSKASKEDTMYHNDETYGTECYIAKSEHNPFSHRNIGHNCHYGVDSYIEQEEAAIQANLAKSTFFSPEAKHETTKPSVQNLIEKGLDMDDSSFNTAIVNQSSKVEPKGVVFVKSFADEVMDAFFQETDSWGQPLKKSEETK